MLLRQARDDSPGFPRRPHPPYRSLLWEKREVFRGERLYLRVAQPPGHGHCDLTGVRLPARHRPVELLHYFWIELGGAVIEIDGAAEPHPSIPCHVDVDVAQVR